MRFVTTAITLLCLVGWTLGAVQPDEGVYIIANQVPSFDGQLVVTFNGEGNPLSVTPRGTNDEMWAFYKYGGNMSVSPLRDGNVEAAAGFRDRVTTVRSANKHVWNVTRQVSGYTIQMPGQSVYWGATPIPYQSVTITPGSGVGAQRWDLIRVG